MRGGFEHRYRLEARIPSNSDFKRELNIDDQTITITCNTFICREIEIDDPKNPLIRLRNKYVTIIGDKEIAIFEVKKFNEEPTYFCMIDGNNSIKSIPNLNISSNLEDSNLEDLRGIKFETSHLWRTTKYFKALLMYNIIYKTFESIRDKIEYVRDTVKKAISVIIPFENTLLRKLEHDCYTQLQQLDLPDRQKLLFLVLPTSSYIESTTFTKLIEGELNNSHSSKSIGGDIVITPTAAIMIAVDLIALIALVFLIAAKRRSRKAANENLSNAHRPSPGLPASW